MKDRTLLSVASLLAIVFALVHLADDVVRGFAPGGPQVLFAVVFAAVWLYAAFVLADRRFGQIVILLASIMGFWVSTLHMRGAGMVGGRIAHSDGMLLWVCMLLGLGVSSTFAAMLAARALWGFRRG